MWNTACFDVRGFKIRKVTLLALSHTTKLALIPGTYEAVLATAFLADGWFLFPIYA